jgi:hypothetical protein
LICEIALDLQTLRAWQWLASNRNHRDYEAD